MSYISPKVCIINVSEKCSLNCPHCYLGNLNDAVEMPLIQIKKLFIQIASLRPKIIGVEGDHSHLSQIVNEAYRNNLNISISASIEYYTPQFIKKVAKKIRSINFSLEGPNAELQDIFRGKEGVFKKTIECIKYAKNIGVRVAVLCAISNFNKDYISDILKLLINLEVDFVAFLYTSPFGRADIGNLSLKSEKWKKISETIEKFIKNNSINTQIVYEPVFCSDYDFGNMCSLYSKSYMAIDVRGNVYFCPLLINRENAKYSLGNIFCRGNNLLKIWKDSPMWKKFRELKKQSCKCVNNCNLYEICGGECFANIIYHNAEYRYPKAVCYMYWRFSKRYDDEKTAD